MHNGLSRFEQKSTDPEGNITSYEYDANKRLARIRDPLLHATSIEYDSGGNPRKITDPLSGKGDAPLCLLYESWSDKRSSCCTCDPADGRRRFEKGVRPLFPRPKKR